MLKPKLDASESIYAQSMKNETPILPDDLKRLAYELDQARRASIVGRGADRIECDAAQASSNFEDAVRKEPEYEEAARQFYAMLVLGRLDCNGADALARL